MTDWDRNRAAIREHLKHDNLEDFLRWSTIRKTMYVGSEVSFIHREYQALKHKWSEWMPVVRWTGCGGDTFHSKNGYASDPNLIHQAYHLKQWLTRTKQDVSKLSSIVEVGAGYGAMALICRRLGFKGIYTIIDLPELKPIQEYYLDKTVGTKNLLWITFTSYPIPTPHPVRCDLLIASHSISEIPIIERERYFSQIDANAYLFASSYEFEGVDNETWLQRFAGGKIGYDWAQWAHPHQENALYQVGVKL